MKPQVSVVMPAFNSEKFVAEAIESVLNQSFKDFEFIVIDDGSTDNTPNIIEEFAGKDERIVYLQNEKNMGVGYTRNRGLAIAKGKYVAIMDSDDISELERLEKQVKYMEENSDIGILGSNAITFSEASERKGVFIRPTNDHDLKLTALYACPFNNATVMIRKPVLDEHNFRYDAEYDGAEDYELFHRMKHFTKFHNLQEKLVRCREHNERFTSQNRAKKLELMFKIFNAALKEIVAEDFYIPLYSAPQNTLNSLKESFRIICEISLMRLKEDSPFTRQELNRAAQEQKAFILNNVKWPNTTLS